MAGKKHTAPAQVYVVVSGHHNGIDATIQRVYFCARMRRVNKAMVCREECNGDKASLDQGQS